MGEYITAHTKVQVQCDVCGHIWEPQARSLLYGQGCPICSQHKKADLRRKTHEKFVSDLIQVSPNIILCSEYIGSHKKFGADVFIMILCGNLILQTY